MGWGRVTKAVRGGSGNVLIVASHVSNFIPCTLSMRALMSSVTLKFCFLKKETAYQVCPLEPNK